MSDKKMLRAIINGQSALKQDLLGEVGKLKKDMNQRFDKLGKETKSGFQKVNNRLDKIGKQVAFLEDDAPTRDEFDGLEERVVHLEETSSN